MPTTADANRAHGLAVAATRQAIADGLDTDDVAEAARPSVTAYARTTGLAPWHAALIIYTAATTNPTPQEEPCSPPSTPTST